MKISKLVDQVEWWMHQKSYNNDDGNSHDPECLLWHSSVGLSGKKKKWFRQHDWKVSLGKKGSRCSDVKVKYKNWDTFAHLRASYIQCSPSKRTFTAKLLTARLLHITHVTGWEIICNFSDLKDKMTFLERKSSTFFQSWVAMYFICMLGIVVIYI